MNRYKIEIKNPESNPGEDVSFRDSFYMTMRAVEVALLKGSTIRITPMPAATTESEFEDGSYSEEDSHSEDRGTDEDPGPSDRDLSTV